MSTTLSLEAIQTAFDKSPFIAFLGLQVIEADIEKGILIANAPLNERVQRGANSNQWHGGAIASVIDTVGDFALGMQIGRGLPTINFRVDYLRPAIDTDLRIVATVRRNGRSVGIADVDVYNNNNVLLAIGRATYSTLA